MYWLAPIGGDWGARSATWCECPSPTSCWFRSGRRRSDHGAAVSDNISGAWRAVAPFLEVHPGAEVPVVGGEGAVSISLYACQLALALGASRVDFVDHPTEHLELAGALGANPIEADGDRQTGPTGPASPAASAPTRSRSRPAPIPIDSRSPCARRRPGEPARGSASSTRNARGCRRWRCTDRHHLPPQPRRGASGDAGGA